MISYSVKDIEYDFQEKKTFLDAMLARARRDKKHCSFGILKNSDDYSNAVTNEYIYTFKEAQQ